MQENIKSVSCHFTQKKPAGGGGGGDPYVLPKTNTNTLGGMIVGDNLTVDENGRVSAPVPVTVDASLSNTSENPVQNKLITARLDEVFTSVSDGKGLIASAITDMGVPIGADSTFLELSNAILLIARAKIQEETQIFNSVEQGEGYLYESSHFVGREVYHAFDGNRNSQWCCSATNNMNGQFIAYVFENLIHPTKFTMYVKNANGSNPVFKLQGNKNYTDTGWEDLTDDIAPADGNHDLVFNLDTVETYSAYRVLWSAGKQDMSSGCDVWEVKIYGWRYE